MTRPPRTLVAAVNAAAPLAPLHPTYPRETTPIGTSLDFEQAVRMCPRCRATLDAPCVTATGRRRADHAGRWSA